MSKTAWALIDPHWGDPVPVIETIRETEEAAREAAITTQAAGVHLYSGAAFSYGLPIKGNWDRLASFGYRIAQVQITTVQEKSA